MSPRDTPSARSRLDPFLNILKLEESKGFQNTAVMGGLDRFLERNASTIADIAGDGDGIPSVPYSDMTPSQRREWVGQWLVRLGNKGNAGPPSISREVIAREAAAIGEAGIDSRPTHAGAAPQGDESLGGEVPSDTTADTTAEAETPPPNLTPKKRTRTLPGLTLESPVDRLRGVDAKLSSKLRRLRVHTIRDLIYLFPRRHNDFSQASQIAGLVPGEEQTIIATVWEVGETTLGQGRLRATEAIVSDETGNMRVIWFGQRYIARVLKPNSRVAISGKVEVYRDQMQFQSPEFELLDRQDGQIHTGRLVPVYPLTEGLTSRRMRSLVREALDQWATDIPDYLPSEIRERVGLWPLSQSIMQAHYPADIPSLDLARRRLAFDEFFLLQMAVLTRRQNWQDTLEGIPLNYDPEIVRRFLDSLPFGLTDAQDRCLKEVLSDIKRSASPMNRLLQGDVGSGKTVVALAALLAAATTGYQGSIMVPTEILAEQHFATVSRLLGGLARPVQEDNLITVYLDPSPDPISVGLLTGSTRGTVKRELRRMASEGTLDILIGTQALIQEGLDMPRLALGVVDEQHRFGVMQRAALRQKGKSTEEEESTAPDSPRSPHLLVMSATPIPRTLALTLYGDLDISTIDELPPGRQRVLTRQVPPEKRDAAYGFVRKEVIDGRQAFVICPLIEESETVEAKAATEEYQRLSTQVFPDLRLGLLHGRMSSKDKDAAMRRFRDGEIDILVSTAVVEVGIDVPNATVMVVEGAHRFGLSQLHQFRGRVGRGEHKSYCLLLSGYSTSESRERIEAMESIHDGFKLAEVDLSMRGPGDFFGTRQSGLPSLRVASASDQDLLRVAREEASALLQDDPGLEKPQHIPLAGEVARFLDLVKDEAS